MLTWLPERLFDEISPDPRERPEDWIYKDAQGQWRMHGDIYASEEAEDDEPAPLNDGDHVSMVCFVAETIERRLAFPHSLTDRDLADFDHEPPELPEGFVVSLWSPDLAMEYWTPPAANALVALRDLINSNAISDPAYPQDGAGGRFMLRIEYGRAIKFLFRDGRLTPIAGGDDPWSAIPALIDLFDAEKSKASAA